VMQTCLEHEQEKPGSSTLHPSPSVENFAI
jgi:hypothetical protein